MHSGTRKRGMSTVEWVGIVLMVVGIALGAYLTVVGQARFNRSSVTLSGSMSTAATMTELTKAIHTHIPQMNEATRIYLWASYDNWIFLAGLGPFAVAGRVQRKEIVEALPG